MPMEVVMMTMTVATCLAALASHVAHTPLPLLHHHYYKQANYTCWHICFIYNIDIHAYHIS